MFSKYGKQKTMLNLSLMNILFPIVHSSLLIVQLVLHHSSIPERVLRNANTGLGTSSSSNPPLLGEYFMFGCGRGWLHISYLKCSTTNIDCIPRLQIDFGTGEGSVGKSWIYSTKYYRWAKLANRIEQGQRFGEFKSIIGGLTRCSCPEWITKRSIS